MVDPVVHFEVIGKDPERLRRFYGDLFGWEYALPAPVAPAISDTADYGFVTNVADAGTGIPGGIGGGPGFESHLIFYVGVADVEDALQRAESLGGHRILGPELNAAGGVVVGHFADPEGNVMGVAGAAPTEPDQ
ncbi:VOC family protein [Leifsonia poae]|uniref:VOC family protein n=1 Tax=Leifsonia poae TaxID=110933 RepID=UPI003D67B5A3